MEHTESVWIMYITVNPLIFLLSVERYLILGAAKLYKNICFKGFKIWD